MKLEIGTPLRPLIADTTPQTRVAKVCRREVWLFEKKGHRAFLLLGLVLLAKLSKRGVDLAGNPGTMPLLGGVALVFERNQLLQLG